MHPPSIAYAVLSLRLPSPLRSRMVATILLECQNNNNITINHLPSYIGTILNATGGSWPGLLMVLDYQPILPLTTNMGTTIVGLV